MARVSDLFLVSSTMELFMKNIPYAADEYTVTRVLEPLLHGPFFHPLSGGVPFNFRVTLLKGSGSRQHQHSGRARLLLPSQPIALHLLNLSSQLPIMIHNRRIQFEISTHSNIQPHDLALLSQPYRDPQAIEEEQRRRQDLQGTIKVTRVRFGYPCHDYAISVEWKSSDTDSWSLEFNVETHQVILKSSLTTVRIIVALKSVGSATLDSNECVFWLERPPIFEQDKTTDTSEDPALGDLLQAFGVMLQTRKNVTTRKRLRAPDANSRVFPFLRVICISFDGHLSSWDFGNKARRVGLNTFGQSHEIVERRLFEPMVLDHFNLWLTRIPFELAFQIEALVNRGKFNPRELLYLRQEFTNATNRFGEEDTCTCIRRLLQDRDEYPSLSALELFKQSVQALESRQERDAVRQYKRRGKLSDREIFQCHRVMVTPTSLVLDGPFPDETNRIIRRYLKYQSNFLRVEFREEDRLGMRWDRDVDGDAFLDERVGSVLQEGITVAGRKFIFLAYSQSALKEHAVWFMTPFRTEEGEYVTPASIIRSLGDFSKVINCPARYGARIAQAFSTTEDAVKVEPEEMIVIPDIKSTTGSLFTDGVGTVSPEIADEIWHIITESRSKRSRRRLKTPSAFQIRLGGVKGMLCVDERLEGRTVCIRPSMAKFESPDQMIEIARAFDRPMGMYLNRPLVMLLETLGVPAEPFMALQRQAVHDTEQASKSLESAARLLEQHGLGTAFRMTSILLQLHRTNLDIQSSRASGHAIVAFIKRSLNFAVNHILRDMKYKARIPVPNAWTLVGVADEWNYLEEGEIFAQVVTIDGKREYIEGPVLISRSPTVHPGDARMVRAVGKPPEDAPEGLKRLTNCVVFACQGSRSLPSALAGGDLDGDIYCLILDERLRPRRSYPAASYAAAELVTLNRPSTSKDVANFVVNYIKSDLLGIIAVQLLRTADISPYCMADPDCIKLAALHSDAVDFPKTGRPVTFKQLPKLRNKEIKPDWYASETNEKNARFYKSTRIIGELFRDIQLPAIQVAERAAKRQRRIVDQETDEDFTARAVHAKFAKDENMITKLIASRLREGAYVDLLSLQGGDDDLIEEMLDISSNYSGELSYICRTHSLSMVNPISEEEVVAGTIVAKCSQPRMRQDAISAMRRDATSLNETVREEIEGPEGTTDEDQIIRAWHAWKVFVAFETAFGTKSFGILALDVIFNAMRSIDQDLASLRR